MNKPHTRAERFFPLGLAVLVAYFAVSSLISAALVILAWPLPYRLRFLIVRTWSRGMLYMGRLTCGLDWVVEGLENLPPGPSVIYIKHSSVWEAYAHIGIFPRQTWVVKKELRWMPVVGWGVTALKCIAIDRHAGGKAVKQVIQQGKMRLAEGIWVSIFPEGTRMAAGQTRRFGISGAALAREADCLIVPVAHNAADCFPRTGLPKRPGKIRLCIGPPIDPTAQEPKETNEIAQAWIESKMAEISEGYRVATAG